MIQVNQKRMEALMRDFSLLTGIRIVLFDNEKQEILSYPENHCAFCEQLRRNPKFLEKCVQSDREAFERCRKTSAPVIYVCHAGLTEAVILIRGNDAVIGYIMFGQIIPQNSEADTRRKLAEICRAPGNANLLDDVAAMPSKSDAEIRAAAAILDALSVYFWSSRLVTLPKAKFIDTLNDYIAQHISKTISIDDVCSFFGVGRTHLYQLANQHLECSIAAHIRRRRIWHAQQLLAGTSRSIAEIAAAAGFDEYNYFSRIFRQETGTTARQYRQEQRNSTINLPDN